MPKRKASAGSRYGKRAKTSTYRRKKWTGRAASRKNIGRIARAVVLRAAETKSVRHHHGKYELNHNTPNFIATLNHPVCMPGQGNGDSQRSGDHILMRGFKIRCLFGQKFDRPNVTFRVLIVACQKGYTYSYSSMFNSVSGNCLLDDINKDRFTVLKQFWMKPQQGSLMAVAGAAEDSKEYTFTRRFWIPRKIQYKFEVDSGTNHQDKDLQVLVAAYDAYGTLSTDNIAYVQTWSEAVYKDP